MWHNVGERQCLVAERAGSSQETPVRRVWEEWREAWEGPKRENRGSKGTESARVEEARLC